MKKKVNHHENKFNLNLLLIFFVLGLITPNESQPQTSQRTTRSKKVNRTKEDSDFDEEDDEDNETGDEKVDLKKAKEIVKKTKKKKDDFNNIVDQTTERFLSNIKNDGNVLLANVSFFLILNILF